MTKDTDLGGTGFFPKFLGVGTEDPGNLDRGGRDSGDDVDSM